MNPEEKVLDSSNALKTLIKLKREGNIIGFCTGCFDILQPGHAVFFSQCKEVADILVVGIGRDSTITTLKGIGRPINPENNRMFLVASMQDVDFVILNDEEILPGKIDFYKFMTNIRPNVFILNDDDSGIREKKQLCERMGGNLHLVKRIVPDFVTATSSSEIINNRRFKERR